MGEESTGREYAAFPDPGGRFGVSAVQFLKSDPNLKENDPPETGGFL